ncbi:MAG: NHL repeat-containing protein [Myxococcota bacterium]
MSDATQTPVIHTTRVASLGASRPEMPPAPGFLASEGPSVVLGGADPLLGPVRPDERTLFGPRGAHLFGANGPLWVADTGHHRLLGWAQRPVEDNQPADFVLGQPDFGREGRNALGDASALTMNVPTGINAFGEDGLIVCDAWNNRVLIWFTRPAASHVPADIVLGQADFTGQYPNRERPGATADSMHWPFQAMVHQGRLYVADTGNRRVLVWRTLPTATGQPADFVLGQPALDERSDNGGQDAGPTSMRWPHDLAIFNGNLVVTDAGDNRVLVYDGLPDRTNQPAAIALGQPDFASVDHNQGKYWPDAECMNMPYAVAATSQAILTGDTANSRLLYTEAPLHTGKGASKLAGQPHFATKGDNRWGQVARDSLCWPYGLQVCGDTLVVSDTGNHRILLWGLER